MNNVITEVGGERHRLVREPCEEGKQYPLCEKCSLLNEDCGLCCGEYSENYDFSYYFIKENEDNV